MIPDRHVGLVPIIHRKEHAYYYSNYRVLMFACVSLTVTQK